MNIVNISINKTYFKKEHMCILYKLVAINIHIVWINWVLFIYLKKPISLM